MESEGVESVGARLRRLRGERGLSQRELAGAGVSYSYVSRIEAGKRQPSARALRLLAVRLEVSPEYLECGRELTAQGERELRLADAELELRLGGDAVKAAAVCAGVLEEALAAGDLEAVARARLVLGLAAAQRAEHQEAVAQLEQALRGGVVSALAQPDLYATLARSYAALDQPEQAVALLQGCLRELQEQPEPDPAAEVRFASYLSYALSDVGEFEQARELVSATLRRAATLTDPYARVRLYWSLARLSLLEGQPRLALRQIQRAIALLEATEDSLHLGRAHLSCGEILLETGAAEQAHAQLTLAEQLLGAGAAADDRGWLYAQQARCAAAQAQPQEALRLAEKALALLGESDSQHRAHAYAALAQAQLQRGEDAQADAALAQAVSLLEQAHRPAEAARLAQQRAQLLRAAGRHEQALATFEQATELALQTQPNKRRRPSQPPAQASTNNRDPTAT